ncbi:hypothetical protein DRN86_02610 [Candidatus Geothermarchaeota archaeon]|nr:MAG: hypothetical protein DRN86_02610 [Candidatus Geothermarchaeota archaeon]
MICCYSCKYWDKASKKIPINAVKVIDEGIKISIKFRDKTVEIPGWRWIPKEPKKLAMIKYLRFCFYGKGLITPWDECENYFPKHPGQKAICEIGICPYNLICPKFRSKKTFYIA